MSAADKLKRRRREEQGIRGYASSSRWYTGLSHTIAFLERAEAEDGDALRRFGDAWAAAYNLFMMYGEPGDEEFKRFNSWITEVKGHPAIRAFFQRGDANQELVSFRSNIEKAKGKMLKAQGQQELYSWGPQKPPDKACRYFFGIVRDMRNTVSHPNFNPEAGAVKKALASAADCLIPLIALAAEALIEKPVEGTTGRTTAYRFFLYPFLKNSDGFFSDYYLERLFPDEELDAFPEEQARDALKSIAKQFSSLEADLKEADSEETLKEWCVPELFPLLKIKPDPSIRIIAEDAVFEPTLVLRRADSRGSRHEYRGKEAAKDVAALLWILPWRTTLDAVSTDPAFESVPVTEVVHGALARSDVPWAIVTNGHQLRLLGKTSAHRPRCFLEADLGAIVDRLVDPQAVRAFRFLLGLFSGSSLTDVDESGKTRLERVAVGSERHGKEIGDELKKNVYDALEELGEGFLDYLRSHHSDLDFWRERRGRNLSRERFLASEALLEDIYHESLSLMYRLLFLFYAESRGLLPVDNEVYQTYSLEALRDDIHSVLDDPDPNAFFAKGSTGLWQRLNELFKFLDKGWSNIIPAYNGGLFDAEKHEFLERFAVSDYYLARAIDLLSRTRPRGGQNRGEGRKKVTYRDLDVRHLGSIYEGILEYSAHIADQDYVVMKTGSGGGASEDYVAADELSREQKQQLAAWREAMEEKPDYPKVPRGCKVTGHKEKGQYYLVYGGRESKRKSSGSYYTPDYIVQYIVENALGPLVRGECRPQAESLSEEVERKPKEVAAAEGRRHAGQLTSDEILDLKVLDPAMGSGHFLVAATEFLARAYQERCIREGRTLGEPGAEQAFIRAKRMIAERCIYGVDLNPMAVELAKLSMWLFTMDPGRPLSFLDHHLKSGNALIGAKIKDLGNLPRFDRSGQPILGEDTGQGNLFEQELRKRLPLMLKDIFGITKKDTVTAQDVQAKKLLDRQVEDLKCPFQNAASVWIASFFGEDATDYFAILSDARLARNRASNAAKQHKFFHWEVEFPEVWFDEHGAQLANPGFDCVVGNPPYFLLQGRPEQKWIAKLYSDLYSGSDDILIYFITRQIELLRDRGRGTYIVSRYWTESFNTGNIRRLIAATCNVIRLVDFRNFQPFGAEVSVICCIPFLEKGRRSQPTTIIRFEDFFEGHENEATAELRAPEPFDPEEPADVCTFEKAQTAFSSGPWFLSPDRVEDLLERMRQKAVRLGSLTSQTQGIKTGLNSAFMVTAAYAKEARLEPELLLRLAKGKDIWPFQLAQVDSYLIYTHDRVSIADFPQIEKHLRRYRTSLEERAECNEGLYPWWRLQRPRDPTIILAPKLLTPIYATFNRFGLSLRKPYAVGITDSSAFVLRSEQNEGLTEEFVAGILNSVAGQFYHKRRSKLKRAHYYEYFVETLDSFPIPRVKAEIARDIEKAVKQLCRLEVGSHEWTANRDQLNDVVFDAYGFDRKERKLISRLAVIETSSYAAD